MTRPRRAGFRHKSAAIALAVSLAVVPAALLSDRAEHAYGSTDPTAAAEPGDGAGSTESGNRVGVDGSLPSPPELDELMIEMPAPGPLGIPGSMLEAYRQAARTLGAELPDCGVDWALLASIGRSESNHARGGFVDADGATRERITGPVLNGGPGVAAIRDTDGGALDGDTTWDRAVGPMQFIPGTWRTYGADGNGDGRADPNNVHDATLAAGRYLCSGGMDLRNGGQLRAALHRYNDSRSYVETVIRWAQAYRDGVLPIPDSDVPLGVPPALAVESPEPQPEPDRPPPPDVMAAPEPNHGGPRPDGGSGGDGGGATDDAGRPGNGNGEATAPKPPPPNRPGNDSGNDSGDDGSGNGGTGGGSGDGGDRPGSGGGNGTGDGGGQGNRPGDGGNGSDPGGGGPDDGQSTEPTTPPTTPPTDPPPSDPGPSPSPTPTPTPTDPPECPKPEDSDAMDPGSTGEANESGSGDEATRDEPTGDEPTGDPSSVPPPSCLCPEKTGKAGQEVPESDECEWPDGDEEDEEGGEESTPPPSPESQPSARPTDPQ